MRLKIEIKRRSNPSKGHGVARVKFYLFRITNELVFEERRRCGEGGGESCRLSLFVDVLFLIRIIEL